ncbi:Hsp20/alpha crystallin family protein [Lachnospiraceae bacterium 46-61]
MMLPSIFGGSLFDDFIDSNWDKNLFGRKSNFMGAYEKNMMKTDIKEKDNQYEIEIDLPGFKKEEINANLENGYLIINASKNEEREEKNESGVYIRRERYTGQCTRSFYVGEAVQQQEIKAKFENGILHLVVPKKQQKEVEQKKYIAIEG